MLDKEETMKKLLALFLAILMMTGITAMAGAENTVELILSIQTTQAFKDDPVSADDLNTILATGLSAASAMNQQPWYFVAISNKDVITEITGAQPGSSPRATLGDSPVAIIVYKDPTTMSPDADLDCGLALQNMVIAANGLGLSTKIVSFPILNLNGENHDAICERLRVPTTHEAVAVLLLGYSAEDVDATSTASLRVSIDEKVSIIE